MKYNHEKKAIKNIDNNIETFKNIVIEQTLKHIQIVQNKKRKMTIIKKIKEGNIDKILINKTNKIKLTNKFNVIHSSINTIFLLFLNFILFTFINPILTQKESNNNRKLTTGSHIELKVLGGNKIKIINNLFIPDRVYINGIESPIDRYGRITAEDDEIFNVTLEWDEKITNFEGIFEDTYSIIEIDLSYLDTSGITSMNSMFKNCEKVEYINFTNINTSSVTTMTSIFEGCNSLDRLDLSNFDTRNVESMDSMFKYCYIITSLNLSNFETPKLTKIREIFNGCYGLEMLDISNITTSLIDDMSLMFYACNSLTSLDITHLDTSNVTNMDSMFCSCSSLESIDLSNMDTSKVTNMNMMFALCDMLTSLNLSTFITSNVEEMQYMFEGCYSLKSVDISNFSISNAEYINGMFRECNSLISLDLSNFDFFEKSIEDFFYGCNSLTTIIFPKENNKFSGHFKYTFYGCSSLKSIDIPNLDISLVDDMTSSFYGCSSLISLDLSNLDASLVTDMSMMFFDCTSLISLNLTNFITSSVTRMYSMFSNCVSLISLDLKGFNTYYVEDFSELFYDCSSLLSLDLSNFDTHSASDMNGMFCGCTSLEFLDISNFNTSLVYSMREMFKHCAKLTSLDLSNFNIQNVNNVDSMFYGCQLLKYINFYNFYSELFEEIVDLFYDTDERLIICVDNNLNAEILVPQLSSKKCIIRECNFEKYFKKKIIYDSRECIENCFLDETYNFEYNDFCYDKCPKGTHSSKTNKNICTVNVYECIEEYPFLIIEDNKCSQNCNCKDFFYDVCIINNINIYSESVIIENIIKGIQEGLINELLNEVINEEKKDIIKIVDETLYQITSSFNQNNKNYENISTIKLGLCEKILKEAYNISENETLIIFKTEKNIQGLLIPLIEFDIFNPFTKEKLNLDYCKNINIDILIPAIINKDILFKYDPNNSYYNNICETYTTEEGLDITLYDRRNEFNSNNMSLCPLNCIYKGYDSEKNISKCHCNVQARIFLFTEFDKEKFIFQFINAKSATNLGILKCYKNFFSRDGFFKNFGNYLIILIILFYLASAIYIYIIGYNILFKQINEILEAKIIEIENDPNYKNEYKLEYYNKRNSNEILSTSIRNKSLNIKTNLSKTESEIKIVSNISDNKNIFIDKNKRKKEKEEAEKVLKLIDYEINNFSYQKAIENDKRTFFQYYISLIKLNHILIFSFDRKKDYNPYIIKICLFFFHFILILVVNSLFFNDSTMHKIYNNKGNYNIISALPNIIYSLLISFIINIIFKKIFLTQQDIMEIKHEKNKNNLNAKVLTVIRSIIIKLIFFFVFSILILLLFWYYISCFCAVYKNTQVYLFKNALISYSILLIYPFIICLIPVIFRISALNKSGECFYKLNQITQLI